MTTSPSVSSRLSRRTRRSLSDGSPASAPAGRAVIASNLPGSRTVVADGTDGLLREPNDSCDLRAKIQYLLDNPDVSLAFGKRGRLKVAASYSWRPWRFPPAERPPDSCRGWLSYMTALTTVSVGDASWQGCAFWMGTRPHKAWTRRASVVQDGRARLSTVTGWAESPSGFIAGEGRLPALPRKCVARARRRRCARPGLMPAFGEVSWRHHSVSCHDWWTEPGLPQGPRRCQT